jgi:Icc-related predicted phosphoesterase
MRLLCTSDLHGHWNFSEFPAADIFIVAGDFTRYGRLPEVEQFNVALRLIRCKHIVVVAGNHDWVCQDNPDAVRRTLTNAHYLQNQSLDLEGIHFWGSPYTPQFYNWAFMLTRGKMHTIWDKIPLDTDVLITHGPPAGKCDFTPRGEYAGCTELRDAIARVKPKLSVFGHIHCGYAGVVGEHTTFLNVSRCNEAYEPVNPPVIFDL